MMIKTASQMWIAALATRPDYLIDKFLDWVEELSITTGPVQVNGLVCIEIRSEARLDR